MDPAREMENLRPQTSSIGNFSYCETSLVEQGNRRVYPPVTAKVTFPFNATRDARVAVVPVTGPENGSNAISSCAMSLSVRLKLTQQEMESTSVPNLAEADSVLMDSCICVRCAAVVIASMGGRKTSDRMDPAVNIDVEPGPGFHAGENEGFLFLVSRNDVFKANKMVCVAASVEWEWEWNCKYVEFLDCCRR
ncbi:hypothetical protein BDZ89DRAFT_1046910 [Hymenopellis radicata]|nr:hypothetical protein BDZ89DRAFT_1046910 [Hymenopellis radicata]